MKGAVQKSVVAVAAFAIVCGITSAALLSQFACNPATLTDLSDSAAKKECRQGPLVFCDAGDISGRACKVTGTETDPRLKLLSPGLYADKCVVNYLAPGHDINGECILQSVCKCLDDQADANAPPDFVCGP
jgi:hypothetical protein